MLVFSNNIYINLKNSLVSVDKRKTQIFPGQSCLEGGRVTENYGLCDKCHKGSKHGAREE